MFKKRTRITWIIRIYADKNRFLSAGISVICALHWRLSKKVRRTSESATHQSAADSFRQAWQEALSEQTLPMSELWQDIQ